MGGGGKSSDPIVVGYHYYMNVHFALAHAGVDELLEIRIGGRAAWRGNINGSGSAFISQPYLFGGEEREGGVLGIADFMQGESSQPVNNSLRNAVRSATGSSSVPAYRGISSIYFRGIDSANTGTPWGTANKGVLDTKGISISLTTDVREIMKIMFTIAKNNTVVQRLSKSSFLWSAMNPYFKTPTFLVRRAWRDWYPEKARIGEDVNPAHIIYETLTNKVWGLGYPGQDIDDDSFRYAADILAAEGFGLSMRWSQQTRINEFIELVMAHINANLVEDRQTGKWRLIMVRDDYDASTLFELNESNCVLENFNRKTLGETVNEVTVAYTRPVDGSTDTVTVQDLANFSNTGQINSQKKEYPGINDQNLAFKIALRDLNTLSKPVAKFTIRCNREIYGHYPGQVVRLNWPRLGLTGVVIRIGKMDLGNAQKGEIQIEAVEDVFGLPQSTYSTPQPIGWVDPAQDAEPVQDYKLYELSYYELHTSTNSAARLDWPEDVGFVAAATDAPNEDTEGVALYDDVAGRTVASGSVTANVVLTADVDYLDTEIPVDLTGVDPFDFNGQGFAWLNDELLQIDRLDFENNQLVVHRAMVDTVPATHKAGDRIWFYRRSSHALDPTVRVDGEVVDYKLLTKTTSDELEVSQAPVVSYTLQNRFLRPYRPGNLNVNGAGLPQLLPGNVDLSVTWAHRDRIQEVSPDPTLFSAGNIGPEPGVTYTVEFINEDGVTQGVQTGLTGTSFDYTTEVEDLGKYEQSPTGIFEVTGTPVAPELRRNTELTFKLKSVRDGLDSYQEHNITVEREGYGYNYGRVSF